MNVLQQLNRMQRREAQKHLVKEAAQQSVTLKEVPRDKWPSQPAGLVKVWRSSGFLVQQFAPLNGATRLSVCRATIGNNGNWTEDITWVELQVLKRECGFGDHWATELFPADWSVVNVANMRHLWLLPEAPAYGWNAAPAAQGPGEKGGAGA